MNDITKEHEMEFKRKINIKDINQFKTRIKYINYQMHLMQHYQFRVERALNAWKASKRTTQRYLKECFELLGIEEEEVFSMEKIEREFPEREDER